MKEVSIIIPTAGKRKNDLNECINSIKNQTRKPDEIIITYGNKGICENLNRGIMKAKGYYVALIDDDATIPNDWIESILYEFSKEPETTAAISTMIIEPGMPKEVINNPKNKERYWGAFNGAGSMIKRHVIEKAGYFPEEYFIYCNERDLGARILKLGYRLKQCPHIKTYHKRPYGERKGSKAFFYATRNQYWYYWRHFPAKKAILRTFDFTVYKTIVAIKEMQIPTLFLAIFYAFIGLKNCLKKREVCKCMDLHK